MIVLKCYQSLILPLLLSVTFCSNAMVPNTDEHTEMTPHQRGLNSALADLSKRANHLIQADQLSYQEQLTDQKGNALIRYYDASLAPDKRWQQLDVIGEGIDQSQLQIDIPILLSPSFMARGKPKFYKEDRRYWIFTINTSVNADSDGQQSQALIAANNKLQRHLSTFIYVDKQTQQFARLKIVNSKPFKPSTLAKIEWFSVVVDYTEAWDSGPIVAASSVRILQGNYGFLCRLTRS